MLLRILAYPGPGFQYYGFGDDFDGSFNRVFNITLLYTKLSIHWSDSHLINILVL